MWQKMLREGTGTCQKCGNMMPLTVDHIIPVALLQQLGLEDAIQDDVDNFSFLCQPCNRFKGGRIELANPRTIPLLKKYVDAIASGKIPSFKKEPTKLV
jgi:5-methylcytosine-specific restriction endonuclease McrA